MKHIFLSIATFFFIIGLNAENLKPVNAKLQKATVYASGAHLYYSENITLNVGNNEFVFENISPYINETTLLASCKNGIITEVRHQVVYKEIPIITKKYDKEIQAVLDSLEDIRFDLEDIKNRFIVLETEKNMLLNNRIMKGQQLRDSLPLLRDGLALLRERLNSIYEQHLKLEKSKSKITKRQTQLNQRYLDLQLLNSGQNLLNTAKTTNQVIVNVFAESFSNTQISFNYFVTSASWIPQYDLQASSNTGKLNLKYYASLTQNTGISWENVNLTLSTSNPAENNIKPTLNPWFLSFNQYRKDRTQSNARLEVKTITAKPTSVSSDDVQEDDEKNEDMEQKYLTEYIAVTENLIRIEYEINMKYTIKSDGKSHKVMINQKDIDMNLKFVTVPKICTDAFLMAKITGWEDMKIIPGTARVYFDNGYVGESYLSASTTLDTLDIDLGRDKTIAVSRNKVKEKTKIKFINDEKVETRTIEITVRNTKNIPVEILVEDQIPVVQGTNEIKVELIEDDDAVFEKNTGMLKWNLKLKSKEQKKIKFTYEITYPKDKAVAGL